MQIEKEILHVLKNATRIGWREDSPEGNRYIQISDTYANELAKRLEAHLTQRAVDRLWRVWAWALYIILLLVVVVSAVVIGGN
jgi:hypothetical protein